ncbi:MAG: YdcH family protein [Novosphingobium sp.]|nr:YdcH family protein [Novosphingobium sp.]
MPNAHVAALSLKHAELDHHIEREMRRPLPDSGTLRKLKSQKLRIKEEMSGI